MIEFYTSQVVNQISEPSTVALEFSPLLHGNLPVNMWISIAMLHLPEMYKIYKTL